MDFTLKDIFAVIDKVKEAGLESFEYRDADTKLRIGGGPGRENADGRMLRGLRESERENPDREVPSEPDPATAVCGGLAEAGGAWTGQEEAPSNAGEARVLISPMVGTFFAAPGEDAEPFVKPGDRVKAGQTVGIVEAMKLMNEVASEWDGVVEEILVKNGDLVEYGQPLLRMRQ